MGNAFFFLSFFSYFLVTDENIVVQNALLESCFFFRIGKREKKKLSVHSHRRVGDDRAHRWRDVRGPGECAHAEWAPQYKHPCRWCYYDAAADHAAACSLVVASLNASRRCSGVGVISRHRELYRNYICYIIIRQ